MKKETLLIVDDQPEILNALERLLKADYQILLAANGADGLHLLKKEHVALILADQRMPVMTGVEFLKHSIEIQPDTVRILITAYADLQASIAAVNQGQIYYYISKPWEPEELLLIIRRAIERFRLQKENQELTRQLIAANKKLEQENITLKQTIEKNYHFDNIIGNSPKMLQVFKLASKVVESLIHRQPYYSSAPPAPEKKCWPRPFIITGHVRIRCSLPRIAALCPIQF